MSPTRRLASLNPPMARASHPSQVLLRQRSVLRPTQVSIAVLLALLHRPLEMLVSVRQQQVFPRRSPAMLQASHPLSKVLASHQSWASRSVQVSLHRLVSRSYPIVLCRRPMALRSSVSA